MFPPPSLGDRCRIPREHVVSPSFLLAENSVGQKPCQGEAGPAEPHGDVPAGDEDGPVEKEAQGVQESGDGEESSDEGVESGLFHAAIIPPKRNLEAEDEAGPGAAGLVRHTIFNPHGNQSFFSAIPGSP